jgi:hypothetical protein
MLGIYFLRIGTWLIEVGRRIDPSIQRKMDIKTENLKLYRVKVRDVDSNAESIINIVADSRDGVESSIIQIYEKLGRTVRVDSVWSKGSIVSIILSSANSFSSEFL